MTMTMMMMMTMTMTMMMPSRLSPSPSLHLSATPSQDLVYCTRAPSRSWRPRTSSG